MTSITVIDASGCGQDAAAWALTQKRVTNGAIRKAFGVSEDAADAIYNRLKAAGAIGYGGYVEVET
jgi:hypothetical protein